MKKLFFIFVMFFPFLPVYSQGGDGDSCANPIVIGPGTHYVDSINGENFH